MLQDYSLLLFGIIWTGASFVWLFHYIRSSNWLRADGVVTWSKIERPIYSRHQAENFEVGYKFEVDGECIIGTNKMPGGVGFDWSVAEFLSNVARVDKRKYPEGASVSVYYNPRNPKDSSLERGSVFTPLLFLFMGAAFSFFAYGGDILFFD
jgi:uncharacterized protein DUF3592